MNSTKSSSGKTQSFGNVLRVGFVGVVVTAICVWMVMPPLETLSYQKYDVASEQDLEMSFASFPDVGPRPIITFSADGASAAYLTQNPDQSEGDSSKSQVVVVDAETAEQIAGPFPVADSSKPLDIAFSRDGTHVAASGANEVRVWGLGDSQLATTIPLPDVRLQSRRHVAISHDGKLIATSLQEGDEGPAICVFDSATGDKLRSLERTAGTATNECFVFHPAANQLIGPADTQGGDAHLCVWDVETGKVVDEIMASEDCQTLAFAFNTGGDRIAVSMYLPAREYNPFATMVFQVDSWEKETSIDNEDYVFWVAFNADGGQLCLVDASGTASIWSTGEGNRMQNFRLGLPSATAFSGADGTLRLVTNSEGKSGVASLLTLRASE